MKKLLLVILLSIFTYFPTYSYAQTVPNASPLYNSYSCNGSTTQFPYAFYINATSDMVVQLTDSYGNITYPTSFSVDTTNVWVNYPLSGQNCPSGYTLTLYASTPITQTTTYAQRTPFTATAVGSSLNKLTIIDQQLQRQINQALLTPVGQPATTFPGSAPGYLIGWNGAGALANINNPAAVAQWTLNGANINYNTGNVSTTNNFSAATINTTGNVGIGSATPGQMLDVTGTTRTTQLVAGSGGITLGGVNNTTWPNNWTVTGNNIYPTTIANNVGIGSVTPGAALDVQGTIRSSGITPFSTAAAGAFNGIGGMSLVQAQTAASASTVTFSGLNTTTYYILVFNLVQNTSNGIIEIRFNGDSGTNYSWNYLSNQGSTYEGNSGSSSTAVQMGYAILASTNMYGTVYFNTNAQGGNNVQVNYVTGSYANAYSMYMPADGTGVYMGSGALTSVTILPSAGTITGTVRLYQLN